MAVAYDVIDAGSTFSTDFREVLAALYTWFNGTSTHWQIKSGVTVPTQVAAAGDRGFVIEDKATSTINIAICVNDASPGGVLAYTGDAIASSDDVLIGIDPGGGITDITSGGFTVGSRWSGWFIEAQGSISSSSVQGRIKVIEDVDFVAMRFKEGSLYPGGFFAGQATVRNTNISGMCLLSGSWGDWGTSSRVSSTGEHGLMEFADGTWDSIRVGEQNTDGLTGSGASDGLGGFYLFPASLVTFGALTGATTGNVHVGELPILYIGPESDAAGSRWKDAGDVTFGYNVSGGAYVWVDGSGEAE